MMRPSKSGNSPVGEKHAWEAPQVTILPIGSETQSAREAGDGNASPTHPQAPATPAAKFGFAIEMALPLSARTEH
jgi:hypothetical protein